MTKWIALPAAFVAAAALALNVEAAPQNAKANSPKTTKTTTKGPSTKGSSATTKGPSTKSTTTTTAKSHGSSKKSGSTTTASTSTNPTTPTTTTTDWKPTNAVAEKLMTKPNQLAKLKAVLPDGTDINLATAGFKNFGQLNAAVNVSQNLGIEFADLKAAMTGTTLEGVKTNEPTKSLGQAIQLYRTDVDAETEAAAATAQATKEAGGQ
jgi:hypothetical protein